MRRAYPGGPRVHLPVVVIFQMFSRLLPYDPLAFTLDLVRKSGDVALPLGSFARLPVEPPRPDSGGAGREQAEKFHKPRLLKRAFRPIVGDGLLTSDGAFGKQQRKFIQPAFHQRQLAAYGEAMVTLALRTVETFENGQAPEIGTEMEKLTLAVVVRSLFGGDRPGEDGEIGECMLAARDAATQRISSPLGLPDGMPPIHLPLRRAAPNRVGTQFKFHLAAPNGKVYAVAPVPGKGGLLCQRHQGGCWQRILYLEVIAKRSFPIWMATVEVSSS